MKKESVRPKDFSRKLAAYSVTAGAALLTAPAANAVIQNITSFSYNSGAAWSGAAPDQVTAGVLPFFAGTAGHKTGFEGGMKIQSTSGGNEARMTGRVAIGLPNQQILNLPLNNNIAANSHFYNNSWVLAVRNTFSSGFGHFLPPHGPGAAVTGYVGFKTQLHGNTYYGWLRVRVADNVDGLPNAISLVDKNGNGIYGAFGSAGILAGQMAPVPEPSITGLGLLALGAAGIRELRRRKSAGTAAS